MAELEGVIAVTDRRWFDFLSREPGLDEVNFWKPSARRATRAGLFTPFLFKLRSPANAICGFGYFARYARLPPWLAWESFGRANGCGTYQEMLDRIDSIRERIRYDEAAGPDLIGCVLIAQPTFFPEGRWVSQPDDWPVRTQTTKRYDLAVGEGARVWRECQERVAEVVATNQLVSEPDQLYGDAIQVRPRIGQGIFRVSITEVYSGACAVTEEHSLPALEASHIRPVSEGGPNDVRNGLLLRADLHRLFDRGYLTVTTGHRLEVSPRLRQDYHNGRTYYPLHGARLTLPSDRGAHPATDYLSWHNENVFVS